MINFANLLLAFMQGKRFFVDKEKSREAVLLII